ncbi:MAG TPA: BON domain-containing protein [Gammaproteobacteria bacterium]|nr:BON domain-containing protein [Gammaproteobacteria bacterium]
MYLKLLPSSSIAAAVALLLISSSAWSAPPAESWTGKTPEKSEQEVDAKEDARDSREVVKDLETVEPSETTASDDQRRVDPSRSADDRCLVRAVEAVLHADKIGKNAELAVDSKDGVIMLEGELPSQGDVDHVQQLVAGVEGVNSVDTSRLTGPEAAARAAQ